MKSGETEEVRSTGFSLPASARDVHSPAGTPAPGADSLKAGLQTLVIGYGNPLRADDGVGPFVAERLEVLLAEDKSVRVLAAFQLTPELADDLSHAGRVVFVDASVALAAGDFSIARVVGRTVRQGALGHEMSPEELLFLCESIAGRTPEAWAIGIGVGSLDMGEGLTPAVARTAERLVKHLSYRLSSNPRRSSAHHHVSSCNPAALASGGVA